MDLGHQFNKPPGHPGIGFLQHAVAQVDDVAGLAAALAKDLPNAVRQAFRGGQEQRRIQIALDRNLAQRGPGRPQVHRGVDAHHVGAAVPDQVQQVAGAGAEQGHRHPRRHPRDHRRQVGRGEFREVRPGQLANPAVEDLHRGGPGGHLVRQVGGTGNRQDPTQTVPGGGFLVHERPGPGEAATGATFQGVAGEGERGSAETDQRHVGGQAGDGQADGLGDVAQVRSSLDRIPQAIDGGGVLKATQLGAVPLAEAQVQAQGFQDHQDIAEDDRGVDTQPVPGIDGDLSAGRGVFAQAQKAQGRPDRPVVFHVPTRLAHQPNRRTVHRFAPAGPQVAAFPQGGGDAQTVSRGTDGGAGTGSVGHGGRIVAPSPPTPAREATG